jgi:hypothetical protein
MGVHMSYDFSAANRPCDHLQILERYSINPLDFKTLNFSSNPVTNMRAPINSAAMLRLYIQDVLVNPADPVYGYSVVADPARIQEFNYPFSKVVFNKPVRLRTQLIEVSYFTRVGFCLKCNATGNVADWRVAPNGSIGHTTGVKKLAQQSLKYVLTSKNPFNQNLVCPIRSYLGKKFGMSITDQDISTAVTKALSTYQSIQRAQKTVQTMDPNEMIQDVVSVEARQDPEDPTKIYVAIVLTAYGSNETIPLNVALQS